MFFLKIVILKYFFILIIFKMSPAFLAPIFRVLEPAAIIFYPNLKNYSLVTVNTLHSHFKNLFLS